MLRRLYTLVFYAILPLVVLRLVFRGMRAPAYKRRINERFAVSLPEAGEPCIWLHSVSVGETIAAAPLLRWLLANTSAPVLVTTMTPTGSDRVRDLFGDRVLHCYAPYDVPGALDRFLGHYRPALALVMETEIWPNTLAALQRHEVPALLINARLSEKSAAGYRRAGRFAQQALAGFRHIAAQTEADAARFEALGVSRSRLTVTGSVKFDIEIPEATRAAAATLRAALGGKSRRVWIAASTHPGEDESLLQVHRQLLSEFTDLLLILVPRHPERFDPLARQLDKDGWRWCRRSEAIFAGDEQVLLGDTMGELLLLLGCADIAFVGGSLVSRGGHNMLEPAAWGLPIVTGSSDFNFADISARLIDGGALQKCADASAIETALGGLLRDPPQAAAAGAAAAAVVRQNRGAQGRVETLVGGYLPATSGSLRHSRG